MSTVHTIETTTHGRYLVQALGLQCFVWTVNRASSMRRAVDLGVDGVITDRPDVLHRIRLGRCPVR